MLWLYQQSPFLSILPILVIDILRLYAGKIPISHIERIALESPFNFAYAWLGKKGAASHPLWKFGSEKKEVFSIVLSDIWGCQFRFLMHVLNIWMYLASPRIVVMDRVLRGRWKGVCWAVLP